MTSGDVIVLLIVLGLVILALYTIHSDKVNGRGCGGCSGNCSCHSGCSCGSSLIKIEDEKRN